MALNTNFWIAAAAAAPIIALANQIVLSDQVLLRRALEMFPDGMYEDYSSVDVPFAPRLMAVLMLITGYLNLTMQAVALITALWSLAIGHDWGWPPRVCALVEGCGLVVVLITAVGTAAARMLSDAADKKSSPPEAEAVGPRGGRTS